MLGFIVLGVVLTLGLVFVLEASLADHRLEVNRGEEVLYSKGDHRSRGSYRGPGVKAAGALRRPR